MPAPFRPLGIKVNTNALRSDLRTAYTFDWPRVLGVEHDLEWTGAALRSHDGQVGTLDYGPSYRDTELLTRLQYVPSFLATRAPLRRVRFLALHPGHRIGWHRDDLPEGARGDVRLHAPVITNSEAYMDSRADGFILSQVGCGSLMSSSGIGRRTMVTPREFTW